MKYYEWPTTKSEIQTHPERKNMAAECSPSFSWAADGSASTLPPGQVLSCCSGEDVVSAARLCWWVDWCCCCLRGRCGTVAIVPVGLWVQKTSGGWSRKPVPVRGIIRAPGGPASASKSVFLPKYEDSAGSRLSSLLMVKRVSARIWVWINSRNDILYSPK